MKHMVAFDCGNSSFRVVLGTYDDSKITMEVVSQTPNEMVCVQGRYFWDFLAIFQSLKRGLQEAIRRAGHDHEQRDHIVVANAVKAEAEAKGVNVEIQAGSEHASVEEQVAILENYISEGVDGIILVPASSDGLYNALKECKDAGIPFIILDTDVSQETRGALDWDLPYYGTNNYNGAMLAGQYVAKNYASGTRTQS